MVRLAAYSVVIEFSHRYIDNDRINFTTLVFLAVHWPFEQHHTTPTFKDSMFIFKQSLHTVKQCL